MFSSTYELVFVFVACPAGSYGLQCSETCQCVNGKCDHIDGSCSCDNGWRGVLCDQPCIGTYGKDCKEMCQCMNGATCDHVTGACTCAPGYRGTTCDASKCLNFCLTIKVQKIHYKQDVSSACVFTD